MGRLLEVFRDLEVEVEGRAMNGRYRALYRLTPKAEGVKVKLEDLEGYVERLNERYGERGFFVKRVERDGLKLYMLGQAGPLVEKLEALEGEAERVKREVGEVEARLVKVKGEAERVKAELEALNRRIFLIRWIWHFRRKNLSMKLKGLEGEGLMLEARLQGLKAELERLDEEMGKVKREAAGPGRLPIYFDLEGGRVFVDEDDYKVEPKLSNYILMRTLGALGISRTRYVRIMGRVKGEG